jgi:hypothetical protein
MPMSIPKAMTGFVQMFAAYDSLSSFAAKVRQGAGGVQRRSERGRIWATLLHCTSATMPGL